MKRYLICARRKGEQQWSVWTDTDDINNIEKHVDRIRELGYEATVTDPAIRYFEKNLKNGYLLKTPVAIGQTVYAVIEGEIKEWQVTALHFDGGKWFAIDPTGGFNEVGSPWCITTMGKTKKLLKELKGRK